MPSTGVYFWKKAPFVRLLIPFACGIILQWHIQFPLQYLLITLFCSVLLFCSLFILPLFLRFKSGWLDGLCVVCLFTSFGAVLTDANDIRQDKKWFGHFETKGLIIVATLEEPLVEKARSFKANARVEYLLRGDQRIEVKGRIIVYFKKEDKVLANALCVLGYGSQIIFKKALQEIRNTGNPAGFDFKRYSLFEGITHQVYLTTGEYALGKHSAGPGIRGGLFSFREMLLDIFRTNIHGEKELGLSEALLIGYKDDLDKSLVQSYSNTGVVHIIAISGMHLALIYWLINLLLQPLQSRKRLRWLKPVLAIIILWLFSLLTGASASVLRAAVMFSFIVAAGSITRKTSIFNTLAASAFCLLCYNPFWLWDVGFQLSYAAVLSIVVFMKPIYSIFYFRNKLLDAAWKLNSVTLAAQILTTPLSIYHFHQFPVYFFLTNLVAVPLSSVIVLGEILLCFISFIPPVALFTGKLLAWLIMVMNQYVKHIESLPGSLWDGMQINILQVILTFVLIAGISHWLLRGVKAGLFIGLGGLLAFFLARSYSFISAAQQQKLIVYNIPQRRAIDFIYGRNCQFIGDTQLTSDPFIKNFHLKPSRTLYRVSQASRLPGLFIRSQYISYCGLKVLLVTGSDKLDEYFVLQTIDLLIVSGNHRLNMAVLTSSFKIRMIVFDSSVSSWRLISWKKHCDSLHIPYHDVSEKGAFVMNMN